MSKILSIFRPSCGQWPLSCWPRIRNETCHEIIPILQCDITEYNKFEHKQFSCDVGSFDYTYIKNGFNCGSNMSSVNSWENNVASRCLRIPHFNL